MPWSSREDGYTRRRSSASARLLADTCSEDRASVLNANRISRMNRVSRNLHHLITGAQIAKDFDIAVDGLSSLDIDPLSLVIAHPNHKSMLLIAGDGGC